MKSQLGFCSGSNTIRLLPQNYCVAVKAGDRRHWIIDADPAVPLEAVIHVQTVLHTDHSARWANTGYELLSKLTAEHFEV